MEDGITVRFDSLCLHFALLYVAFALLSVAFPSGTRGCDSKAVNGRGGSSPVYVCGGS